ncbi:MAG: nucleoside:proton symporter [Halobacteriovoraceae bacterium]|nr:nucleoside:proton symporter [Halobacteriovoraceae bacterium]|tara:strand:+ start:8145 stop:9395 length:1251 start_codon:yes stop_codon:yes gene_type:complete
MLQLQSALGILVFIGLCFLFSEKRSQIQWKMVTLGVIFQILLGVVLIKLPFIADILLYLNQGVLMLEKATLDGTQFMFGYLAGGSAPFEITQPAATYIVAFRVLPIVLVMSAITSVLFHWGVLQKIVLLMSKVLEQTLKISGVQGLSVASNIFLGMIESPLFVKGYLSSMSRSSLFVLMTAGMATVAGTVMVLYASILNPIIENAIGHILIASLISAPAAVMISHIIIPPEHEDMMNEAHIDLEVKTHSTFEALVQGVMDGIQLLLAIAAMIIVLFSLVSLVNQFLALLPVVSGRAITIEYLVGFIFYPLTWLMGIASSEVSVASELMAVKTILNEFVSYQKLATLDPALLSERSKMILMYAMCGFANLASLGLIVATLGTLVPQRRGEVLSLSFKCILSGTFATMMTGCVIGLIY